MEYQEQQYKQKITLGSSKNSLVTLIAICMVLFCGFQFMKAVWFFKYPKEVALAFYNKNVLSWFVLPADFDKMMSQPWSVLTYMFIHDTFWRIFPNMLWLWCFGYIMQDLTGNKKIIPLFIYG